MHLIFKFILLAIALAYGATTVSAIPVPVRQSSVAARSDLYDDLSLNAREIDDIELFVRGPPSNSKLTNLLRKTPSSPSLSHPGSQHKPLEVKMHVETVVRTDYRIPAPAAHRQEPRVFPGVLDIRPPTPPADHQGHDTSRPSSPASHHEDTSRPSSPASQHGHDASPPASPNHEGIRPPSPDPQAAKRERRKAGDWTETYTKSERRKAGDWTGVHTPEHKP